MQKKNWLSLIVVAALLVTGFLVFSSSAPIEKSAAIEKKDAPTCCKENMSDCPLKKKASNASGEMIIDNLSRQFISVPGFCN